MASKQEREAVQQPRQPAAQAQGGDRLEQELRAFLREGQVWERVRTSVPGLFVVKLPGRERGPELALEINPVDASGRPKKRIGYMIRERTDLDDLLSIVMDSRIERLMEAVERINPRRASAVGGRVINI